MRGEEGFTASGLMKTSIKPIIFIALVLFPASFSAFCEDFTKLEEPMAVPEPELFEKDLLPQRPTSVATSLASKDSKLTPSETVNIIAADLRKETFKKVESKISLDPLALDRKNLQNQIKELQNNIGKREALYKTYEESRKGGVSLKINVPKSKRGNSISALSSYIKEAKSPGQLRICLLYTSDAADE